MRRIDDFSLIKTEHVEQAARDIIEGKYSANPSTGYDVVINDQRFPPKEVVRLSYRLATGHMPEVLYGGKMTNDILAALGYVVERKIRIWKLGCYWEKGAPVFYDTLKEEKFVITVKRFSYRPGDLVLVTIGFPVLSIARVTEQPVSVTTSQRMKDFCEQFEVEYSDDVLYAACEWYTLPETEVFSYSLQAGIRRVQQPDIIQRTIDTWENRNLALNDWQFFLSEDLLTATIRTRELFFILKPIQPDENENSRSAFELSFYKTERHVVTIGMLKIIERDNSLTSLDTPFVTLDEKFASLGQNQEYYDRLQSEFPSSYVEILRALRDVRFFTEFRQQAESFVSYRSSLLRSSEAERLISASEEANVQINGRNKYVFSFTYKMDNAPAPHVTQFSFDTSDELFDRFFCIVGKNGTGKTRYLAGLAHKLIDITADGNFEPQRPHFTKIIATSFSYFDNFELPDETYLNYDFIGARSRSGKFSDRTAYLAVWAAYEKIILDELRRDAWIKAISTALDTATLGFRPEQLFSLEGKKDFSDKVENIFSSGQKIAFHFLTRVIAIMEPGSLVLFDEPETHLHPNAVGKLLIALRDILKTFDSFCVLSTHSPVIVQEIPSRFIRIFERRQGDIPDIFPPTIECLGENMTNISNYIFHIHQKDEIHKLLLQRLAREFTEAQITDEIFDKRLSLNAQIFLKQIFTPLV
jgi:predicted ATPase